MSLFHKEGRDGLVQSEIPLSDKLGGSNKGLVGGLRILDEIRKKNIFLKASLRATIQDKVQ